MARKVTDLIKNTGSWSYSYEVTPDIREEELDKLDFQPLFFSITWHGHQHRCKNLEIPPVRLATYLRSRGEDVVLHISCTHLRKTFANDLLAKLKEINIINLFIITGENFNPQESDFKNSQELITYIRSKTRNYFCIGSAGFPGDEENFLHLREKVNTGVDFLITQAFFDDGVYDKFVAKCKKFNINIPIIPGIFPYDSPKELQPFLNMCKIHLSSDLTNLINVKSGNEIITNLINIMKLKIEIKHFHFFTLNKLQRITDILKHINL